MASEQLESLVYCINDLWNVIEHLIFIDYVVFM